MICSSYLSALSQTARPRPSLKETIWRLLVASCLLTCFAAQATASVVFLPSTDQIKVTNDGFPYVFVDYGKGTTYQIWEDKRAANLRIGLAGSGVSNSWSIWNEYFDEELRVFASKLLEWRELPIGKQRSSIRSDLRGQWDKDMFVTSNSPKRYPVEVPVSSQVNTEPQRDSYGCLPGEQFYEYKGFLGIGKEKLGCMTPAQAAALHQQRSQAWRNVNTQNQINQMQYQQQQTQLQNQQQQYRMGQQLYYQQQQLNRLRNGY